MVYLFFYKKKDMSCTTIFYRLKLLIQINRTFRFIPYRDIVQIECDMGGLVITLISKRVLYTYESLSYFENNLPSLFIRIHRSYLVNLMHIVEYSQINRRIIVTMSDSSTRAVSRNFKKAFLNKIAHIQSCTFPSEQCQLCVYFRE